MIRAKVQECLDFANEGLVALSFIAIVTGLGVAVELQVVAQATHNLRSAARGNRGVQCSTGSIARIASGNKPHQNKNEEEIFRHCVTAS